jgi:hypothetical protein
LFSWGGKGEKHGMDQNPGRRSDNIIPLSNTSWDTHTIGSATRPEPITSIFRLSGSAT